MADSASLRHDAGKGAPDAGAQASDESLRPPLAKVRALVRCSERCDSLLPHRQFPDWVLEIPCSAHREFAAGNGGIPRFPTPRTPPKWPQRSCFPCKFPVKQGKQGRDRFAKDCVAHHQHQHAGPPPPPPHMVAPPSANSVWPVTKEAASEARKAIAAAISSGRPRRPIGTLAM